MRASGRGVASPWKRASITSGTAGAGETVGVAVAAGVSVITKLVAGCVAVSSGGRVAVASGAGVAVKSPGSEMAGIWKLVKRLVINRPIPATRKTPSIENARRARMVFC